MMRAVSIFGPTASGKSSLALQLASDLNGVIISADSMQIYRGMDIGTAKATKKEQEIIPHRLINICDPIDRFSVYDFKQLAEIEIQNAFRNGKLPIIAGGTGLYLDALFFNTDFGEFEIDPAVKTELEEKWENGESFLLLEKLQEIDPESALPLHEKDKKRILRALEVYYSTGNTLSFYKKQSHEKESKFSFLKFFLTFHDRQNLYRRINLRVDQMIKDGLLEETEKLMKSGAFNNTTAAQAIGYKELFPYLNGNASLEECVETLKQKTRNYAKRQLTWFRRYHDAIVIEMDETPSPFEKVLNLTKKFLKEE